MKCLIFGSAPINSYDFLKPYISGCDLIICADGGLNHTTNLMIEPDAVIGDFDSCNEEIIPKNAVRYPSEKDDTDMMLCVNYAKSKNCSEIIIAGGLGGRLDHTMANVSLLAKFSDTKITLIDEKTEVFAIFDKTVLNKNKKKYISFISFTDKTEGITYKGLKYLLSDATLYAKDAQFSISNEFAEETAEITLKNGILVCIRTSD